MSEPLDIRLVPPLAAFLIRLLRASMRIRYVNSEAFESFNREGKRYVLAFWHRHLLLMVFCRFARPISVMISQHRDGELIARTMGYFGVESARGSTTRGGSSALRDMLRLADSGGNLAFTPDGPKGPASVAQVGVVLAAQRSGFPIFPVAFISAKKKLLRSWDRFEIPYPFSRGIFIYGDPIPVDRQANAAQIETLRLKVEESLNDISLRGERDFDTLFRSGRH